MRVPLRRPVTRYFRIASGFISSAMVVATPVSAQECKFSDELQKILDATRGNLGESSGGLVNPGGQEVPGVANGLLRRFLTDTSQTVDQTIDYSSEAVQRAADGLCDTVKSVGVQSGVAVLAATSLTGAIMGRLDAGRVQAATGGSSGGSSTSLASAGTDGRMALGATEKGRPAPPPGTVGPFTVFAGGTFLGGNGDISDAPGFSYGGSSGMLGLEYSVNRNLILGIAGSFTTVDADLNTGGTIGAEVIHGAAYLSYATQQWFVDALAGYGVIDLEMERPEATGSTSGGALAVAARGGYLFNFGKVRAGPIAGLTYVHARIDGYTETGVGAMTVGDQTVESLTGSAGLRFLAPFQAGGTLFVPYLNVTLEHFFGDGKVELTTGVAGTPPGQISVSFPTFGARDYGKLEGGITIELAPSASISVSGASTFARDDGHDYRVSAGLNYRF